jgi:hypothetical protein
MKKNLKTSFMIMIITIIMFAFIPPKHSIVGHWTITYESGDYLHVNFRDNNTFRTEVPSANFVVEGKYKLNNDILSINDTSCNDAYWGKYKITFYGNDSIYSEIIEDSCSGRRSYADKVTLVMDKK